MHICSEIEWATKFQKPAVKDAKKIDALRLGLVMYCLDDVDNKGFPVDKGIYGADDGRLHKRIDLLYQPCDPVTFTSKAVLKEGECFVKNREDKAEMAAKLKSTIGWIGVPDFTIVYNNMRMDLNKFEEASIGKESRVMNRQFDINQPSWIHGQLFSDVLNDDTTILNSGTVTRPFKHLQTVGMYSSAWTDFPNKYKFISYQLNIFDSQVIHSRKTMNWMELVGNIGGLIGFINLFAAGIVSYFTAPQFASYIANRLYTWMEPENITRVFHPELFPDAEDAKAEKRPEVIPERKRE